MDLEALLYELRSLTTLVYVQTHDVEMWLNGARDLLRSRSKKFATESFLYSDSASNQAPARIWQPFAETTKFLPHSVVPYGSTPFQARFAQAVAYDPKGHECVFFIPSADSFFGEPTFVPTVRQALDKSVENSNQVRQFVLFGSLDLPNEAKALFHVIHDRGPTLGEVRSQIAMIEKELGFTLGVEPEMFLGCSRYQINTVIARAFIASKRSEGKTVQTIHPIHFATALADITRAYPLG